MFNLARHILLHEFTSMKCLTKIEIHLLEKSKLILPIKLSECGFKGV